MCNLYSMTRNVEAIRRLFGAMHNNAGNLPSLPGIFPDYPAPIVRNVGGERELTMARWGMPSPSAALLGKKTDPGVTNIRNTASGHWRRWLGPEHRCLVPFTSFSEYDTIDGKKVPVWFAADDSRPLLAFAGLFVSGWKSIRKVKDGEVTADLFGFLTCDPNTEVARVHPKAMPVILTTPKECEQWLKADWSKAATLQRPLPDGFLKIVASGEKEDPG